MPVRPAGGILTGPPLVHGAAFGRDHGRGGGGAFG